MAIKLQTRSDTGAVVFCSDTVRDTPLRDPYQDDDEQEEVSELYFVCLTHKKTVLIPKGTDIQECAKSSTWCPVCLRP